jgi:hypothetical protein
LVSEDVREVRQLLDQSLELRGLEHLVGMGLALAEGPNEIEQFVDSIAYNVDRRRINFTQELSVDKDVGLVNDKNGLGGFLVVRYQIWKVAFHVFGNPSTHEDVVDFLVESLFFRLVEHLAADFRENVVLDFGLDVQGVEQDLELFVVAFAQVFGVAGFVDVESD